MFIIRYLIKECGCVQSRILQPIDDKKFCLDVAQSGEVITHIYRFAQWIHLYFLCSIRIETTRLCPSLNKIITIIALNVRRYVRSDKTWPFYDIMNGNL